jgi:hypothetical protein
MAKSIAYWSQDPQQFREGDWLAGLAPPTNPWSVLISAVLFPLFVFAPMFDDFCCRRGGFRHRSSNA